MWYPGHQPLTVIVAAATQNPGYSWCLTFNHCNSDVWLWKHWTPLSPVVAFSTGICEREVIAIRENEMSRCLDKASQPSIVLGNHINKPTLSCPVCINGRVIVSSEGAKKNSQNRNRLSRLTKRLAVLVTLVFTLPPSIWCIFAAQLFLFTVLKPKRDFCAPKVPNFWLSSSHGKNSHRDTYQLHLFALVMKSKSKSK